MCPDRDILSAYLDGEVDSPWDRGIEEHLVACGACRARLARLEEMRRILQEEPMPDVKAPMERVRRSLLARSAAERTPIPLWRRSFTVPVPAAVVVLTAVVALAALLAVTLVRSNVGTVRITKVPSGGTEIQIAAPIGNLETLLKSVDTPDSSGESVIKIPKSIRLMPIGEPRMGKAADFLRKKTW
jgi:anti-sigma factor RsiW